MDGGRNPDLYTRALLAGLVRESEIVHGKLFALARFEELLVAQVVQHFPHLETELRTQ